MALRVLVAGLDTIGTLTRNKGDQSAKAEIHLQKTHYTRYPHYFDDVLDARAGIMGKSGPRTYLYWAQGRRGRTIIIAVLGEASDWQESKDFIVCKNRGLMIKTAKR